MIKFEQAEVLFNKKGKTYLRYQDKFIKMFPSGYSKHAVFEEAINQLQFERAHIHTPKIYEVTSFEDRYAIVMDFVEGDMVSDLDAYVKLHLDISISDIRLLHSQSEQVKKQLSNSSLPNDMQLKILDRIENSAEKNILVCHGDYHPKNIIVDKNGELVILDFEFATNGNICLDVARGYILSEVCERHLFAEKYVNLFCDKSGRQRKDIDFLIPVAAALHFITCTNPKKRELLKPFLAQL